MTSSLSGTQWVCLHLRRGLWNWKVVARREKPELDLEIGAAPTWQPGAGRVRSKREGITERGPDGVKQKLRTGLRRGEAGCRSHGESPEVQTLLSRQTRDCPMEELCLGCQA